MKLPVGVYAVSQSFEGAETAVDFTFQGVTYQAQPGVNAFCYLEELTAAALQAAQQPFCGYQGIPVVILPAGLYKIGTVQESRFRTQLPCAMAILGENAGVSPNCDDLRTANPARQEETVIQVGQREYQALISPVLSGEKVVSLVPAVMPSSTAHSTAE